MTVDAVRLLVLPGVPGFDDAEVTVDGGHVAYPEGTPDFAKCALLMGISVEYIEPREDRRYVGFKALEDWLPIIQVALDLVIGVEGGLLVELLKSYLWSDDTLGESDAELLPAETALDELPQTLEPPTSDTLLHVDWRVVDGDRESRFRADGKAPDVLMALARFEQNLRDE